MAMETSEKVRLAITVVIVVLLNAAVWFFVFRAQGIIADLDKKIHAKQLAIADLDAKAKERDDKAKQLRELKQKNKERLDRLPALPDRAAFVTRLTELEQGLHLVQKYRRHTGTTDLAVDIPGCREKVLKDIYSTQYEADFPSLCSFLNTLEEHEKNRIVAIENFSLAPKLAGMDVEGAKHLVTFNVVTYHQAAAKAP